MKKLLTTLLLFIAFNSYSQAPANDTAAPKIFYLLMPEKNWAELLQLIKTADEKPSKIKEWEQLILSSLRLYEEPKKESKKP